MNDIEKKIEDQHPGLSEPTERRGMSAESLLLFASLGHIIHPYGDRVPPRRKSTQGWHRGECRKPKNLSNDPDRAPGMQGFPFRDGKWISESEKDDGPYVVIYAGTLKAAKKKLALLTKNGIEPTPEP